jgi:hypothetical protein
MGKVKLSRAERELDAIMKRVAKELKQKDRPLHHNTVLKFKKQAEHWSPTDGRPTETTPIDEESARLFNEMKVREF